MRCTSIRFLAILGALLIGSSSPTYANSFDSAILLKESGRYQDAARYAQKNTPESAAKKLRMHLNMLAGNPQNVLAEPYNQNDWEECIFRGLAYEQMLDTDKALKAYADALRVRKNSIALWRTAKLYWGQNKLLEAKRAFIECLSFDSSLRLSVIYTAQICVQLKDWENAYRYALKGIGLYPENTELPRIVTSAHQHLPRSFFLAQRRKRKTQVAQRQRIPQAADTSKPIRICIIPEAEHIIFTAPGTISITCDKKIPLIAGRWYIARAAKNGITVIDYTTRKAIAHAKQSCTLSSDNAIQLLDVSSGSGEFFHTSSDRAYRGTIEIQKNQKKLLIINHIGIDAYLCSVLPSEMFVSYGAEALKAQAIAARTWAFRNIGRHAAHGYDFCSGVHCQAYTGAYAEHAASNAAVYGTAGKILTQNGQIIEAFYHANCGGLLRKEFFGVRDYLQDAFDTSESISQLSAYARMRWFISPETKTYCYDAQSPASRWQRIWDQQDYALIFGQPISRLKKLTFTRATILHLQTVTLDMGSVKKYAEGDLPIRKLFDNLRSCVCIPEIIHAQDKSPLFILMWGAGFGHGAGMCQDGARGMANNKKNYKEILRHYYPGAEITEQRPAL